MVIGMIRRSIIGTLLLMICPTVILMSGWQWQPFKDFFIFQYAYYITETASYPWAIITSAFFALLFIFLLKVRGNQLKWLIIVLVGAMLVGQAVKSMLKETTARSRPFVLWLEKEYKIDDSYFYSLPRAERSNLLRQRLSNDKQLPEWMKYHWQNETGYSFPSGHTIFSATWALLAIVLLWPRRYYMTVILIMAWSFLVLCSRLVLGMHWPTDLIIGCLISGLIAFGSGYWFFRQGVWESENN